MGPRADSRPSEARARLLATASQIFYAEGLHTVPVIVRELADRFPGVLHTAVGQLDVYPNSPVVVASNVRLLLDLRCADEVVLAEANRLLRDRFAEIERIEAELSRLAD